MAPFQGQTVFSVTSNSTVSAFMFDSSKKQLSFTVSGPSGTRCYTEISIPKTMIDDISSLQVKLDNSQINYNAQSQADSWLVTFNYHHSTHTISVSFDSAKPQLINQFGVYAVIAAVIASAAFIWISRKKSRRGEIRPVFAD